jgi:hypothetical protein
LGCHPLKKYLGVDDDLGKKIKKEWMMHHPLLWQK